MAEEKPTASYEFTTIDEVRVRVRDHDRDHDIQDYTIKSVAFNSDGSLLAFTYDNKFKMYKMNGDEVKPDPIEQLHGESPHLGIQSLSFHPKLPFLLTGSHDSTAKLWHISTESVLSANCVATTEPHELDINRIKIKKPCHSVAFHPTVPVFATGSGTKTVKLWRFNHEPQAQGEVVLRPVKTLGNMSEYNVWSVAFHPTMPFLAASDSKYAKLWKFPLNIQEEEPTYVATLGMSSDIIDAKKRYDAAAAVYFRRAGIRVVFSTFEVPVEEAEAAAKAAAEEEEYNSAQRNWLDKESNDTNRHNASVRSVAFHPMEPILVTGSWDNTAKLWSFSENGSFICLATIRHDRELTYVAFHPDPMNSILATCSLDNKINLWRLSSSGKHSDRITTIVDLVDDEPVLLYSMAFHPTLEQQSIRLVSGGTNGTVKLCKVTENIANSTMGLMNREADSSSKFMTISEKRVQDAEAAAKGSSGGKNRTRHRRRLSRKQQRSRSRSRSRGRRHRRGTSKNPH